jgi:hypothetical protein
MTTTERPTLPLDAQPYLAAVRDLLWALPADERDELLDDLSAHLAELAAEDGPPLRERLGAPSTYAADFVASAGVEPPPTKAPISMARVRSFRLPPALRERLTALRPAWLAIRPFLLVFGGAELFIDGFGRNAERFELVLLTLAAVAAISLSQRLTGMWDRLATVAAVLCGLTLFAAWTDGPDIIYVDQGPAFQGVTVRGDGTPISNIWAYDVEGNPIDAFLFDQDGQPLIDITESGWDQRTGEEIQTPMRTDADGRPIPNLFPRSQIRVAYDAQGRPYQQEERAPVVGTPPVESSTTTTVASESTTTTTATTAPPSPTTTVTAAP